MSQTPADHGIDGAASGFFRRSTIRIRLGAAFLAIAAVLALQGGLGVWQLEELARVAAGQPDARALQEALRSAQGMVGGVSALVFGLAFALCYPLTVHIVKPVRVAARIAQRVADGDLTVRVRTGGSDEAAQLLRSLAAMTAHLRAVLGSLVQGAHAVQRTSAQIMQGNLDLTQRTEEQASTLEETASSIEQLTATVAQNAERAREASQFALQATAVARRGGEAGGPGRAHDGRDLRGLAQDHGDRRGDRRDRVPDQHPGAQRRGGGRARRRAGPRLRRRRREVRGLAQRSAAAAREIKDLIDASVDKVQAGAGQADDAGRTMVDVVDSVEKVSALIAEIAQASQEQSAGIGQVNTAIGQMQRAVERNAAMVEQATQATESMNVQAKGLLDLASRFRLAEGAHGVAAADEPRARARVPPWPRKPIRTRPAPVLPAMPQRARPRAVAAGAEGRGF